jgi:tripartite-type tricarboxylate transporter receptor subunit TctC
MRIRRIIAATVMLVAATAPGFARNWPACPVTMVVTFAAGGWDDLLARIISP